jgi:hypothetical protein
MNHFQKFQDALEQMYPGLSVFSDINWDQITKEYIASFDERPQDIEEFVFGFPEFLQEKASRDECPDHLFELAYYELLENNIIHSEMPPIDSSGLHMNPTLSFLNLEYDISQMIDEATKGNIQIIPKEHILCVYRHPKNGLHTIDISTAQLTILQELEKGPIQNLQQIPGNLQDELKQMLNLGLVLEV